MPLLTLARIMLAPVLFWQGRQVRRRLPPLPEAPGARLGLAGPGGSGHAMPRLRVLVVGDSAGAGVGARSQDEALAAPLAATLARRLRAPVAWQLVARSGWTAADATEALRTLSAQGRLPPADVLVTALGVNDAIALTSPSRWVRRLDELERCARELTGVQLTVLSAIPPMHRFPALPQPLRWVLGHATARLNRAQRHWAAQSGARVHAEMPFDPAQERIARLMAADGFHPGPVLYRHWAEALARQIGSDWSDAPTDPGPQAPPAVAAVAAAEPGSGRGRPSRSMAT
ncbi:MAG: hypothetical protein RLZZ592_991 [Pseudomonadota bacterium]|jgi:lysophospholipase L1-like esterase